MQKQILPSVLIIEDDPIAQKIGCYILKSLDYSFDLAPTGELALELIHHNHYDLILTDLGLPDICNIEWIKKLKSSLETNTPIIVLTAHGGDLKQDCLSEGACDFYTKPTDLSTLKRSIQKWTASYHG